MAPEDEEHDDLLARIQAAGARVTPGPTAGERVRGALLRRRRRRRAQLGLASVTAVAALSVAGVVVVPGLLGDDVPVAPADEVSALAIIEGGGYRPAGFFKDVVGGTAVPSITRYYRTLGKVVFTARFEWSPDASGDAFLADLSLERYRSEAEQRCERLVRDDGTCEVRQDGSVLATYEVPADGAFLAPIGQEGRLRLDGSSGVLRGATYFRTDAKAVTVLVCNCSSLGGEVLSESPRVSFEVLEDVVTDPSWGLRPGG
ncbi:hypothetical protein [Nocardioides sp.]|uniref:hypothetical protein n=1 Tax=Nocardioides sp. TaxID=35761 RepID=UPI000C91FBF8|nr:hypothetical protein [Pimelobacter sp.]